MKKLLLLLLTLLILTSCSNSVKSDDTFDNSTETEKIEMNLDKYPRLTNLPTLYITLDGGYDYSEISHDSYIDSKATLVSDDDVIYEQNLKVKGRGNYNWIQEKKPYTIKFDEATDVLGMGEAKKWVLINNYSDKSFLRSYLTYKLAADAGIEYTTDCEFVDLYINNEYLGLYLLSEKVEIQKNRVDIDKDKGGILFEIEAKRRHDNCDNCYNTTSGVHLMFSEPELSELGVNEATTAKQLLDKVDKILPRGYDKYSEVIDVDSFINWYIINEIAKDYDQAFQTSCFCYIANDGKLHMGPMWDYDTAYGNHEVDDYDLMDPTGFYISNVSWFKFLLNDDTFKKMLCERWNELYIDGIFDNFYNYADEIMPQISASIALDNERWPNALKVTGLRDRSLHCKSAVAELEYIENFYSKRIEWLNSQWAE